MSCVRAEQPAAYIRYLTPPRGDEKIPAADTMALALLRLLALVIPASAALCSVTASGGRLRLAGSDDLVRVAQLQLDTFDPAPDTQRTCADTYIPGPPYCTYGLRLPAACVLYAPEAQGSLP